MRPGILLPNDLLTGRQAVESAKTLWLTAQGVHAVLHAESQAAAAKAEAAQGEVTAAAVAVMRGDAAELVRQMRAAEQEAGRLRAAVTGHVSVLHGSAAGLEYTSLRFQQLVAGVCKAEMIRARN